MFGSILSLAVDAVLSPVENVIEVVEGLTEGELREKAILSLGADVVSGMAISEIIDWYEE